MTPLVPRLDRTSVLKGTAVTLAITVALTGVILLRPRPVKKSYWD